MILIHAADLHLGSPLGGLDGRDDLPVRRIRQAPMRAFERIAELCAERTADVLVIAGDLFDGDADLPTMYDAARVIERITRAGTKVVALRGNHDAASKMQGRLPGIEGFHELPTGRAGTIRFDDLGIALHGRGFDTQHVPDNIVPGYPDAVAGLFNVGVLHTSLAGNPGHDRYAPATIDDLAAKGYDYWALGHVHKRQVHAEQPWIVFPGNPQGRDVGETGPRGVTVVEYDGPRVVGTPEAVVLDSVRWHVETVELAGEEELDDLRVRIGTRLAQLVADAPGIAHVVRLRIGGRGRAHDELIAAPAAWRASLHELVMGISADDLYLERVVVETRPALPPREELLAREDFIGSAARSLLGSPDGLEDPPPVPPMEELFAPLARKLGQLPAAAGLGDLQSLDADAWETELTVAREALVGRLLAAHAEEAEATR